MGKRLAVVLTALVLFIANGGLALPAASPAMQDGAPSGAFDKYGGSTLLTCSGGAQGKFYTERIRDRWWLCTPAGNVFWAMGVYQVLPDNTTDLFGVNHYSLVAGRYAQGETAVWTPNWCLATVRRLKSWGFNTLDMYAYRWILPWTDQGSWFPKDPLTNTSSITEKMPAMTSGRKPTHYAMYNLNNYADQPMKNLMNGLRSAAYTGWRSVVADYFDDRFVTWMAADLAANPAPSVHSDWLLGVVVDDTDHLWWAGAGTDFETVPPGKSGIHGGWTVLATAPVQVAGRYNEVNHMYRDATVYTKERFGAFLQQRYGTVSDLNAAWGANYTTFGSTGTAVERESVAIGDDVTDTYSVTLTQPRPSPFSVQVLLDDTPVAGDNGEGAFLTGGGRTAGSVNYLTGQVVIALNAPAPNGSRVSVNYVSCGFGCGSGVLDEDGTRAWVPRVALDNKLTGGTAALLTDLDDFLYVYAESYFADVREQVGVYYPGHLYFGPSSLGSWSTPGRRQVLQAAARHLDVLRIVSIDPMRVGPDWLERLNYIAQWGGDKPWTIWTGARANPDSYFANDPRGAAGGCAATAFQTQEQRGQWYQTVLRGFMQPTADGVRHLVGVNFWELIDNRKECANWGLMTRRDNPYDGVSAVIAEGTDAWGYPTGGEAADYGDFLSFAKAVNWIWVPRVFEAKPTHLRWAPSRGIRVR